MGVVSRSMWSVLWTCQLFAYSTIADDPTILRDKTPTGVEFGLWGNSAKNPAPTLFILSGTIEGTLGESYFRQCGNELAELGYLLVSIDLPCHGNQGSEGDPSGLNGWSYRVARNENIVSECNKRLSKVLDHLIDTGRTDPNQVAVSGTSRGGFMAIHFAAYDRRVKCAAGFAPVTDLAALREFRSILDHPLVEKLNLRNQAEKLTGRPVWIVIGDRDDRVGTNHAIELATRLSAVAKKRKVASNVEIHVMSEPRGHTTPHGSTKLAAGWIHRHLRKGLE